MTQFNVQPRREESLAFLFGRINYERTLSIPYGKCEFRLDRMHWFLERLGNPHEKLKIVHVAGTKGKGSTSAMIAASLSAAGYRTGLYTSPHLDRLEERFVIDGQACSATEFVELIDEIRPVVEQMDVETCETTGGRFRSDLLRNPHGAGLPALRPPVSRRRGHRSRPRRPARQHECVPPAG